MNSKNEHQKPDLIKEIGLTYDDYLAIDDGNTYELSGGQLELMSPAPTVTHQIVSYELQKNIALNCESEYLILNAPVDVILASTEIRQPDLVLVHRNRLEIVSNRGIEGAPDLVIEILSPSTLKRDKIDKLEVYARYRIPEYWIVEPKTGVLEQYFLVEKNYKLQDIFQKEELISSPNIMCVSFTMDMIMDKVPDLPDSY